MAGTLLVRDGIQDSPLFEALKNLGLSLKVIYDTRDSCIDIWIGNGSMIQFIDITKKDIDEPRCKTRIEELVRDFPKTVVIIMQHVGINSKCFYQLQELLVIENELSLVCIEDEKQGAKYIKNLLDCSSNSSSSTAVVSSPHPLILQAVQCLPQIGKVKSLNLLENFKSISGIANATKEELAAVVSACHAQTIYTFLHESAQ